MKKVDVVKVSDSGLSLEHDQYGVTLVLTIECGDSNTEALKSSIFIPNVMLFDVGSALLAIADRGTDHDLEVEREANDSLVFSGPKSILLWSMIHSAHTIDGLRSALYKMGCELQKLEHQMRQR